MVDSHLLGKEANHVSHHLNCDCCRKERKGNKREDKNYTLKENMKYAFQSVPQDIPKLI